MGDWPYILIWIAVGGVLQYVYGRWLKNRAIKRYVRELPGCSRPPRR